MRDGVFGDPRLVEVYDLLEGDRVDLPHNLAIAAELGARSVLDVGCGTGTFACILAALATMTGNVSNVFLTEQEWSATLTGIHAALRSGGHLVFEAIDPASQPWLNWNRETTYVRHEAPDSGTFESWMDVTQVDGDLVNTRRTYVIAADRATLNSDCTRRYPPRAAIEDSLVSAGYELADVRGAPDRPGRELVFVARKPAATP